MTIMHLIVFVVLILVQIVVATMEQITSVKILISQKILIAENQKSTVVLTVIAPILPLSMSTLVKLAMTILKNVFIVATEYHVIPTHTRVLSVIVVLNIVKTATATLWVTALALHRASGSANVDV
jgi:hypothetical protein